MRSTKYPRITQISMPYAQIEHRYPLLLRAMRWAAILSATEAADCVRALQERKLSGEAADHFGGPLAVLAAAIRCRGMVRYQNRQASDAPYSFDVATHCRGCQELFAACLCQAEADAEASFLCVVRIPA